MSETLTDFLNERGADTATLQHAVRYLAAELSGDATLDEMLESIVSGVPDPDAALELMQQAVEDPRMLEALDLAVLQAAWEDETTREAVKRAVLGAKGKLPVVEVALITAGAIYMYKMWLDKTGGRKRQQTAIRQEADGTYVTVADTEWYGPAKPLTLPTVRLSRGTSADALEEAAGQDGDPSELGQ